MARPPLPLGQHGSITVTHARGHWVARCRVRDLDGVTRKVERWGPSRTAARKDLQDELRQRRGERTELLRSQFRFRDAADVWMAKIAERREDSTADTYRHWLDNLVLPQLGELRLYECDVAQVDAFFTRLEQARRTVEHEDDSTTERVRYAVISSNSSRGSWPTTSSLSGAGGCWPAGLHGHRHWRRRCPRLHAHDRPPGC